MGLLVLMEQGVELGVEGDRFVVRRAGKDIQSMLVEDVDQVILFGRIDVTPPAVSKLLWKGIDAVYLTLRGRFRGRLVGYASKNIELRIRQYRMFTQDGFCLSVARNIVKGKLRAQRGLLLRVQRERKDPSLAEILANIRICERKADGAADTETLRGIEGAGSSFYFSGFGSAIKNREFSFSGRSRRPPLDPVNACLSFGYTMLGMKAESVIMRAGLEPLFGLFHKARYGRPSLMLDIIEELRTPTVDMLTLRMVNRKQLRPSDFESPVEDLTEEILAGADFEPAADDEEEGGRPFSKAVFLGETGRKVFFREFARRWREKLFYMKTGSMLTYEQILESQVYHLSRVIMGEEECYKPFNVP